MTDFTRILSAIEQGDSRASEKLLPLVYDELRKLAAQKLAHEKPGQTLQATALVHEAYLRLVASENQPQLAASASAWDSRHHFFAAAAEAMRRILLDRARDKGRLKRGVVGDDSASIRSNFRLTNPRRICLLWMKLWKKWVKWIRSVPNW